MYDTLSEGKIIIKKYIYTRQLSYGIDRRANEKNIYGWDLMRQQRDLINPKLYTN